MGHEAEDHHSRGLMREPIMTPDDEVSTDGREHGRMARDLVRERTAPSSMRSPLVAAILWAGAVEAICAQTPPKVEFVRDVQPVFRQYCIGCHGPSQQMNGLRLDDRASVFKAGARRVVPGGSENSLVYLRLIGSDYGLQMPPTGALPDDRVRIIKAWIDQGADWPDELAGNAPLPPRPDADAALLMEALRGGDRQAVKRILSQHPNVAALKGHGGSTPLMYATLYGTAEDVGVLLNRGADPNAKNDAGATALMWALDDIEKTRLLLAHGADPNARSEAGRTPLGIAAGRYGSSAVVALLLDHGASLSVPANGDPFDTPLPAAAYAANDAVVRLLVDRGADLKGSAPVALLFAMRSGCARCVDALIGAVDRPALNIPLVALAPFGNARDVQMLLERGADVNARVAGLRVDLNGRTPLMLAASSDLVPVEAVKVLIARGADVNLKGPAGETALDLAKRNGSTAVVEALVKAGAQEGGGFVRAAVTPRPAASVRSAVERSVPLLQRSDVTFIRKSGCVSCHNDTFTAMTVSVAREHGLPVDEQVAQQQLKRTASFLDSNREGLLQGTGIPSAVSNILVGMAAEHHAPDLATDAVAYYLKNLQLPDGRWREFWIDHRPPIQSSDITLTGAAIRALRVYAPKARRAEYEKAVDHAVAWLMKAQPRMTDERALQLLGLAWAGVKPGQDVVRQRARELVAEQRPDGGWAQLPSLASDAYATGQALVALKEAGALRATDAAYTRGVQFLMNTQLEDGSWYVKTRSIPIQPYFESDFPHGPDQWISIAATNWAAMALAPAAR